MRHTQASLLLSEAWSWWVGLTRTTLGQNQKTIHSEMKEKVMKILQSTPRWPSEVFWEHYLYWHVKGLTLRKTWVRLEPGYIRNCILLKDHYTYDQAWRRRCSAASRAGGLFMGQSGILWKTLKENIRSAVCELKHNWVMQQDRDSQA